LGSKHNSETKVSFSVGQRTSEITAPIIKIYNHTKLAAGVLKLMTGKIQ
jgi:hypothetical protein